MAGFGCMGPLWKVRRSHEKDEDDGGPDGLLGLHGGWVGWAPCSVGWGVRSEQYGLQRAQMADFHYSLEVDGTPTDHFRVLASAMFGVPYAQVTEQQRWAAKKAKFFGLYR